MTIDAPCALVRPWPAEADWVARSAVRQPASFHRFALRRRRSPRLAANLPEAPLPSPQLLGPPPPRPIPLAPAGSLAAAWLRSRRACARPLSPRRPFRPEATHGGGPAEGRVRRQKTDIDSVDRQRPLEVRFPGAIDRK